MKAIAIVLVLLVSPAAFGGDCPPPKSLSCERILQLKELRCPPDPLCPPAKACPLPTDCPTPKPVTKEVPVFVYEDVTIPMEPKGRFLFGGGPVYFHGLGATMVAGYQFKNRLMLLGGPLYVPQSGTDGYNVMVKKGCKSIPYTVAPIPAKHAYGGQVLAVYAF